MSKAICAFDIDDTVTCAQHNARDLISWCKDRDIPVALVTARSRPVPPDDWRDLGFTSDDLLDRFHYNPASRWQSGNQHGQAKVRALENLMHSEGVRTGRDCVVLLDDMAYNTDAARRAGFAAIQVGDRATGACGISDLQLASAKRQLGSCMDRRSV